MHRQKTSAESALYFHSRVNTTKAPFKYPFLDHIMDVSTLDQNNDDLHMRLRSQLLWVGYLGGSWRFASFGGRPSSCEPT